MSVDTSHYRRPLPAEHVAFSSDEGRRLFREALAAGGMEAWFPLSEQLHTQSDPAFCGLGSLVVVLNALGIDPQRRWKGSWRWFGEELLDCCWSHERVRAEGLTLEQVQCLATCNGARATLVRPETPDVLRADLREVSGRSDAGFLIAAYDRATLGQTGTGHFSPLGGFHAVEDRALILDVARFKYPPHWVPVTRLWTAMQPLDPSTGRARGYLRLTRDERAPGAFRLRSERDVAGLLGELAAPVAPLRSGATPLDALAALLRRIPAGLEVVGADDGPWPELDETPLAAALREAWARDPDLPHAGGSAAAAALLALAWPDADVEALGATALLAPWRDRAAWTPRVCAEAGRIRDWLAAAESLFARQGALAPGSLSVAAR